MFHQSDNKNNNAPSGRIKEQFRNAWLTSMGFHTPEMVSWFSIPRTPEAMMENRATLLKPIKASKPGRKKKRTGRLKRLATPTRVTVSTSFAGLGNIPIKRY